MKVTRTNGGNRCELNATEQACIDRTIALCDQLAYHYRGTDLGDSMSGIVGALTALLMDTDIVPVAKSEDEQPKGD